MGPHASRRRRPTPSDDARTVLDAIRTVVQALRESSREAEARAGVSGAQLFVLQVLARESPLSIAEVAQRTHTHPSSVSVVVQRLADRALVERKRSAADGRRWDVALTTAGEKLVAGAPALAQERLAHALEAMGERQRRGLADGLATLIAAAGLGEAEPPMFFEESTSREKD